MRITNLSTLAEEIIAGANLKPEDDVSLLLEAPLAEVQSAAGEVQRAFCGKHVDLCTILNGRSGKCSEDCKYCAQAACHHTGVEEYPFLPVEEILENAQARAVSTENVILQFVPKVVQQGQRGCLLPLGMRIIQTAVKPRPLGPGI